MPVFCPASGGNGIPIGLPSGFGVWSTGGASSGCGEEAIAGVLRGPSGATGFEEADVVVFGVEGFVGGSDEYARIVPRGCCDRQRMQAPVRNEVGVCSSKSPSCRGLKSAI